MLKLKTLFLAGLLAASFSLSAQADNPRVKLETGHGDIVLELFADKAPKTVDNFLGYVESGFYGGTIFHRVIQDFMIQGGGYTTGYEKKPTGPPITNEADNGLANKRGTVAMARTGDPHSATSQFFINTTDNPFLDFKSKEAKGWGYCVFARVVEGLDTVDSIASVPTSAKNPRFQNAPEGLVVIEKASIIENNDTPSEPASSKKESEQ